VYFLERGFLFVG